MLKIWDFSVFYFILSLCEWLLICNVIMLFFLHVSMKSLFVLILWVWFSFSCSIDRKFQPLWCISPLFFRKFNVIMLVLHLSLWFLSLFFSEELIKINFLLFFSVYDELIKITWVSMNFSYMVVYLIKSFNLYEEHFHCFAFSFK